MTDDEETRLKELIAGLLGGFEEMQQGMKLMTDVVVKLERRVADLEHEEVPKSKIIMPFAARN